MEIVFKQKKGITLIALVITIIVLLLLAGISINSLSGDNNLLKTTRIAKEEYERVDFLEAAKIAYNGLFSTKYLTGSNPTLDEVVTEMRKNGYKIEENTVSGTRVTGVTLSNNSIGVEKNGTETKQWKRCS